jgi:hypothetical protein
VDAYTDHMVASALAMVEAERQRRAVLPAAVLSKR